MLLTIQETAMYSNIRTNKIDSLLLQPIAPFATFIVIKKLNKRRDIKEYISKKLSILNYEITNLCASKNAISIETSPAL